MKFGSLFSGIGGFDLGFARVGMTCEWQCEIDKAASSVLARRFPGVPNIGDVRNVKRDNVSAVDLVCGGFPCQDLSVAGKRAGLVGERSGLWFEFRRVLDELRPQWVIIENVPGLLSSNGGRDFATVLRGLVELRYGVCWRVLDAQYFGVAQRRRRVFIVGSLGDGRAAQVLFESEGMFGHPPARGEKGQGITPTVANSINNSGLRGRQPGSAASVVSAPRAAHHYRNDLDNNTYIAMHETGQGFWNSGDVAGTIRAEGENRPSRPSNVIAFGGNNTSGDIDVATACNAHGGSGRIDFESETFVATLHTGAGIRRLTPTECERLQGFPDGWTNGQSDSARYRQLGNAVAVPVIEWIGRRIMASHLAG